MLYKRDLNESKKSRVPSIPRLLSSLTHNELTLWFKIPDLKYLQLGFKAFFVIKQSSTFLQSNVKKVLFYNLSHLCCQRSLEKVKTINGVTSHIPVFSIKKVTTFVRWAQIAPPSLINQLLLLGLSHLFRSLGSSINRVDMEVEEGFTIINAYYNII